MKGKRLFSILISVCLILTLLPTAALAEGTAEGKTAGTISILENPTKIYDGKGVEAPSVQTNSGGTVSYTYYDASGNALSDAPVNAGTYSVAATVAATANYTAATTEKYSFTIAKRPVVLGLSALITNNTELIATAVLMNALGSDAGTVEFTITPKGQTDGTKVTKNLTGTGDVYTATAQLNSLTFDYYTVEARYVSGTSDNYTCASPTASASCDKSLEARYVNCSSAFSKTYGTDTSFDLGATASISAASNNNVFSYMVVYDSYAVYGLGPAVQVSNTGNVTIDSAGTAFIKISLADNNNYYMKADTYVKVQVSPAPLAVTSQVKSDGGSTVSEAAYGTAGSLKYSLGYSGFLKSGSTLDTAETFTGGHGTLAVEPLTNTSDAGARTAEIVRQGAGSLTINETTYDNIFLCRNYTLTYTKASLNVTKATPAVSVANQTAKIGWGLDELTVPASANGVNGETVPGTFTWSETNGGTALGSDFTFSGSAGGTKTLYWTFTPADGTNYNTTSGSTVFTLKAKNAAALTLTAGKTSGVTYGDSVTYTAAVGKANSADTETFSGTLKLYLGSDATGTPLGESDAGSTLSVTLDKSNLTAGSHTVTAVYSGNRDYGSAAQSVTTSVAQSKIVAAADSKTMTAGGTLPAFTVSYTGIASGDTAASIFSAAAAAACKADGKTAGSYDITVTAPVLTAAAAANYTVGTPVSGKLTVSAAPSSSSGSSGGGTTAPSVNQSEKSVVIDAGNSSVSDSQIQSALETAKKNNFSTISIVSTAASGSVSLSASAVGYLVSGGTQLSLETKNGGIVSVAPAVFQGLGLKASDQVSVGMTDAGTVNGVKTFTVDLSVNGTAVHDLNGAVGLDFPVDTAWNGKAAVIAHTHASGAVTYAGAVVKDGLAAVNVTDLSTFKVELASALPAAAFSDVKPEDWCFGGIEYAVEQGFLKGTSAATFSPNASLTRGQLVTVLWRMAGSPAMDDYGYPYEDVNALTNAFAPAVYWARAQGIANGYSDEKFAPNAAVNREQLAAILYRYAQYKKYDVSVGEDTNILSYTDAFRVSEYAIPALQWACGAGVIQGSGNALMPFGTATRAQAAVILQRFCQNTAKK